MHITQILIVIIVGIFAGIINTIAGGGTLIVFPLLIFIGIEPIIAVATNRFAIMIQTFIAVLTFRKGGVSNIKMGIILAIPATIASLIGAYIATIVDKSTFRTAVAILIMVVLAIIIVDPKRQLQRINHNKRAKIDNITKYFIGIIAFFLIGLYGGFFGAGVGIMMLTATYLIFDMEFLQGNSVKVVINFFISIGAVVIFAYKGKINYILAIPLSIANGIGAYIGAKISIKGGHKWIRRAVLIIGLISIIKLIIF